MSSTPDMNSTGSTFLALPCHAAFCDFGYSSRSYSIEQLTLKVVLLVVVVGGGGGAVD